MERHLQYAGLWRRVGAAAIDSILLIAALWLIILATATDWAGDLTGMVADFWNIHPGDFGQLFPIQTAILGAMVCVAAVAISWIYGSLVERSARQATIGKMAMGIVVTALEEKRISFLRGIVRNLGKIASALPALAGFIMIRSTAKKQGLHDILAGCLGAWGTSLRWTAGQGVPIVSRSEKGRQGLHIGRQEMDITPFSHWRGPCHLAGRHPSCLD